MLYGRIPLHVSSEPQDLARRVLFPAFASWQWDARDRDVFLATTPTDRESLFAIEAQHLLVVHHAPFASQELVELLIPPAWLLRGELTQPCAQLGVVAAHRATLPARATQAHQSTYTPLATRGKGGEQMGDPRAAVVAWLPLSSTTSLSIALSRERSATGFFSRRFSSSRPRSRSTSETWTPSHLPRQR